MTFVRHWLPAIIVVAGVATMIAAPDRIEGGVLIVSAGLSVWLLNWLWRIGVAGDDERRAEDDARRYYSEHGRWPDEPT